MLVYNTYIHWIYHMKPAKRPAPTASPRPPALLFRFRETDAWNGVTKRMLQNMATHMNLSETDTVHMALAAMARSLKLTPTAKVIVNPTVADLKGMDFSGLRRVVARAADYAQSETRGGRRRKGSVRVSA